MLSDDCRAWKPEQQVGVGGDDRPHVHRAAVGQHHVGLEAVGLRGTVGRRRDLPRVGGYRPAAPAAGSAPPPPCAPAGGERGRSLAASCSRWSLSSWGCWPASSAPGSCADPPPRPGAASVGRSVGGAVGTRRELDLPHLQRSVLSEMLRHVRPERGRAAVPPEFRVRLHPDDKATVDQAPGFFRQGLEEALAKAGREHGWDVPARVRIELEADPARRRGVPGGGRPRPRRARAGRRPAPAPAPAPPGAGGDRPARAERRARPRARRRSPRSAGAPTATSRSTTPG